ncbi:MAG: neutral/alkaline non-lysosomal ceramidase N-terminal domain-containing protein [Acidobacteria bacterium]|nr:neutral/alkaline non-lysosomal ceramidase N-terminal domain-containing protein [Acidobacteriota bacterium]
MVSFCFSCSTSSAPQLRAGTAAVDITPEVWPLPLIGNFSFRPSESAHDPLHVRAIALDDGQTQLAIAVVDSCYVQRDVLDDAKQRASERTGIPTSNMLVSATHTHSAPPAKARYGTRGDMTQDTSDNEEKYSEQLRAGIAEAISKAYETRVAAEVGSGRAELAEELSNRRWFKKEGTIPPDPFGGTTDTVQMNPGRTDLVKPAGPVDPEISVLSVRTAEGKPLALLANYSLHYVGGIPPGNLVSADYFGEFGRLIKEKLAAEGADPGFVGILSNGTSGDVNNIDFTGTRPKREPFEQIRIVAGKVANKSLEAYKSIEHRSDLTLAMAERILTLDRRKPTAEGYEQAKKVLTVADESTLPRRAKPYAERAIELYEGPDTVDVKLQAIRIGTLGIAAIPFETFTEIGLEIKAKSALKPAFTIELANGGEGYLPTPEQHELGGYETWLGTNRVEKQASVKITKTILELLNEISRAH